MATNLFNRFDSTLPSYLPTITNYKILTLLSNPHIIERAWVEKGWQEWAEKGWQELGGMVDTRSHQGLRRKDSILHKRQGKG